MAPMQGTGGVGGVGGGGMVHCCLPSGDCRKLDTLIPLNELSLADCIRVLCNNENCSAGQYMHRECFEWWEASVLQALKANGRARSWSERQRLQHLWTKKGYELVQKACSCKCGRGQLRKDLDWVPPSSQGVIYLNGSGNRSNLANGSLSEDDDKKKAKKKRNRNNNNNNGGGGGGGAGVNGNTKTPLSNNNGNSYAGLTPNPNVGVIGSGLPHNNGNTASNGSSGNNGSSGVLQTSALATFNNILNTNNVLCKCACEYIGDYIDTFVCKYITAIEACDRERQFRQREMETSNGISTSTGIKRLATESKSALQVRVPATRQPCFHVVYFAGFWHKHICTLHACGTEPTRSTFAWQLQSNMLEGKRPASNLIRTSFEPQRK